MVKGLHITYIRAMKKTALILMLSAVMAGPALADWNMNGVIIDCYCTDTTGGKVDVGEMACLQVDGKMFMAQCDMSLNVPIWRKVSEGCMTSSFHLPASRPGQFIILTQ